MPDTEIARDMFVFTRPAAAAPAAAAEPRPEVSLIERTAAGDREAFNELYRLYSPMVHGIVLASVPHQDVQDIVQDVFIAAYTKLHTLRDRNFFGGWLAKIARNRAAEFHRQKRPAEELNEEIGVTREAKAEAIEVLAVIRSLPPTFREPLVLRLVEGMSGIEIAERTGMTHDSVRVNLHRGMEMLRKQLGIPGKRK